MLSKLARRLLLAALLAPSALAAQPQPAFATGLLFEDDTYDALPRQSAEDGSKAELPAVVDLTPYCPEVRHQGYILSCVGWAAGYSAMSIQRAILNRCTDREVITRNAHSALFLYNQIKTEDCKQGARISDALRLLAEQGDCLARQFDFEVNNCEQAPDSAVTLAARRYAIQDYLTLFGAKELPDAKVFRVKKVLAAQKPVVVGMAVLHNFYGLQNAQYWHPTLGNTTPAGGHAMTVVGYDDRREAFRLMNSWGKNWGDNGYIWVKYSDFGQYCKYAYALYLLAPAKMQEQAADGGRRTADEGRRTADEGRRTADGPEQPANPTNLPERPLLTLSGSLEFRALTGWTAQTRQPIFEAAEAYTAAQQPNPPAAQPPAYRLRQAAWPLGQLFQLMADAPAADQYLYVFSVDAQRTVHFHWPRQAGLNEKFDGLNESALFVAGSAQVAIPGPMKALKLAQPGTDRLVLLFSKKKVDTVQRLAALLAQREGDFAQNLRQLLGKFAVPTEDVRYFPDRIGFEASTRSEGFIVPLVLEVECR
jgi:hypothetical protein